MSVDDPLPGHRLSLASIAEAARLIDPVFRDTPQFESDSLSRKLGCRLVLKVETANPIRTFKGRGAAHFLRRLRDRGETRQLVCASTGNFGQAMAWAAREHGFGVVVYADERANSLKLERIADLGGEVRLAGVDFDAAKEEARRICRDTGAWMVEDGQEPEISEGAGSIGVELTQIDDFDAILIPVGNGALIGGVARWMKAMSPRTRVVGVSAVGADSMEKSWRGQVIVERPTVDTIAEGIAVRVPVPAAVDDMRALVDEMVLVSDRAMLSAMRLLHSSAGQLVEPAGAAGVAAILETPDAYAGTRVATILTGNNITSDQSEEWLG